MGMENSVEDRLWDKDVQEFIEACKHCQLSDVLLDYTVMDGGRKILNVTGLLSLPHARFGHGWVPVGGEPAV